MNPYKYSSLFSSTLPNPLTKDQNKPCNQLNNKDSPPLQSKKITSSNAPLSTYRDLEQSGNKDDKKWEYLTKFNWIASKAHLVHGLKFQTLFLACSLAEKTVNLMEELKNFQYWTVACLYIAMKQQQIYPPRLKTLSSLVKQYILPKEYYDIQLRLLQSIDMDLHFINLNTMLSQYLHSIERDQRFYIFYLLELALIHRKQFYKYTLKEIVLSVIYVLSSHQLYFTQYQIIDGICFERISSCSKLIILNQNLAETKSQLVYRKYKSDSMKMVAYRALPTIKTLRQIIEAKTDKQQNISMVVGLCQKLRDEKEVQSQKTVTVLKNINQQQKLHSGENQQGPKKGKPVKESTFCMKLRNKKPKNNLSLNVSSCSTSNESQY